MNTFMYEFLFVIVCGMHAAHSRGQATILVKDNA